MKNPIYCYFLALFSMTLPAFSGANSIAESTWSSPDDAISDPDNLWARKLDYEGNPAKGIMALYTNGEISTTGDNVFYADELKAAFYDQNQTPGDFGGVKINDIQLVYDASFQFYIPEFIEEVRSASNASLAQHQLLQNLWGTHNTVSFFDEAERLVIEKELYVPQDFHYFQLLFENEEASFMQAGTQISWNPDPHNAEVLLMARYIPASYANAGLDDQGSDVVFKNKLVPDNGRYEVQSEDLEAFPAGAYVSFTILRGTYERLLDQSTDQEYAIGTWASRERLMQVLR